MKLLIHSNSPKSPTGYGVQVALLADRLCQDGHEVAVSCTHGQETGIGVWETPHGDQVLLYPRRFTPTGADILHGHANHFFKGDPQAGWIIPLIDVWALRSPFLKAFQIAAWTPIDHLDAPPGVLAFFDDTHAIPIAMSRHGETCLLRNGIDATYIPLVVDTQAFKPTPSLTIDGQTVSARELFGLHDHAFVVAMVAMNKGNVFDRKGWSECFYGFGQFRRSHPDAVLFVHSDAIGAEGISLRDLARDAGIPSEALAFTDQYAYTMGFSTEMMAAVYTAADVLLAASHGEGFCVPVIEAQACGTAVIVSNATAQPELVGMDAGWLVDGQRMWDESQLSPAFCPFVDDVTAALELAYKADLDEMQTACIEAASHFDADVVFEQYWRPLLDVLAPSTPDADKPPMTDVAVVVPVMKRPENVQPLVDSFDRSNDGTANLYFVCDADDEAEIAAVRSAGLEPLYATRGHTFPQKANTGYLGTSESFVFVCGDDCEFTPGWLDRPRELSDRYDVIGTNDAEPGRTRNQDVASGKHADHWFTRRTYIDDVGSCLEGPGVFCPEAYYHWWVDKEVIGLAKARGVFSPALESRVVHHHPGFDGDEDARLSDPVYMKAVEWADRDAKTFERRESLIEQYRQVIL